MKTYNKLIRDKVVDQILSQGEDVLFHRASPEEYRIKLREKLHEEISEFLDSETEEEMADILEVLNAIIKEKGWDNDDIVDIQKEKREAKGGFDKAIILEKS
jgi:predicted house-cleaning noncanonical NTP pyrophosphatase (MazG superfamily)